MIVPVEVSAAPHLHGCFFDNQGEPIFFHRDCPTCVEIYEEKTA